MANLQKKTKAELIMLCNERNSEIQHLRKEVEKTQKQFDITDKELIESRKKYHALESNFKGSEESFVKQIKELNTRYSQEVQAFKEKISEKDKTIDHLIAQRDKTVDDLVFKNSINKRNAYTYKLTTIIFIILFVITLIYTCI